MGCRHLYCLFLLIVTWWLKLSSSWIKQGPTCPSEQLSGTPNSPRSLVRIWDVKTWLKPKCILFSSSDSEIWNLNTHKGIDSVYRAIHVSAAVRTESLGLSQTPWCAWATCLSVSVSFWLLQVYRHLSRPTFTSQVHTHKMELPDHTVILFLIFLRNSWTILHSTCASKARGAGFDFFTAFISVCDFGGLWQHYPYGDKVYLSGV